jgi:hypothetical protein
LPPTSRKRSGSAIPDPTVPVRTRCDPADLVGGNPLQADIDRPDGDLARQSARNRAVADRGSTGWPGFHARSVPGPAVAAGSVPVRRPDSGGSVHFKWILTGSSPLGTPVSQIGTSPAPSARRRAPVGGDARCRLSPRIGLGDLGAGDSRLFRRRRREQMMIHLDGGSRTGLRFVRQDGPTRAREVRPQPRC